MYTELYGLIPNNSNSWDVLNRRLDQIVKQGGTIQSIDRQLEGATLYVTVVFDPGNQSDSSSHPHNGNPQVY